MNLPDTQQQRTLFPGGSLMVEDVDVVVAALCGVGGGWEQLVQCNLGATTQRIWKGGITHTQRSGSSSRAN